MPSARALYCILLACSAVFAATSVKEPAESTIQPSKTDIDAVAATQSALAPVTNVKGAAFDRFYQVWLENTVSSREANFNWQCFDNCIYRTTVRRLEMAT
jgi:acid phosphatase